jgi:hypothetical protein
MNRLLNTPPPSRKKLYPRHWFAPFVGQRTVVQANPCVLSEAFTYTGMLIYWHSAHCVRNYLVQYKDVKALKSGRVAFLFSFFSFFMQISYVRVSRPRRSNGVRRTRCLLLPGVIILMKPHAHNSRFRAKPVAAYRFPVSLYWSTFNR